jgi:membrane-associated protease RseP (regulator of RpoE activity)
MASGTSPTFVTAPPPPPPAPPRRRQRTWLHVTLFVLTFVSAMWSQSLDVMHAQTLSEALLMPLLHPSRLATGLTFAVTLMAILLAHEMGHYLTARRYGVDQSLPFFIPAPTFFGTLGAVILMRSQPPNRQVLLRVAVMGPYMGLALAVPAAAWGLAHSTPIDATFLSQGTVWFGESLLWQGLAKIFGPDAPDIALHPVGLAAWVGLFVTSLNLIPAAQLDGGHVAYALFGRRQEQISRAVVMILFAVGVTLGARNPGGYVWVVWAVLLFAMGLRHPPVRDELAPLSRPGRIAGYAALAVFALTFIPVPITSAPPDEVLRPESQPLDEAPADGQAEEFRL